MRQASVKARVANLPEAGGKMTGWTFNATSLSPK